MVEVTIEILDKSDGKFAKFIKRLHNKIISQYMYRYDKPLVEVKLRYPNYKSGDRACRNFAKNADIVSAQLSLFQTYIR